MSGKFILLSFFIYFFVTEGYNYNLSVGVILGASALVKSKVMLLKWFVLCFYSFRRCGFGKIFNW